MYICTIRLRFRACKPRADVISSLEHLRSPFCFWNHDANFIHCISLEQELKNHSRMTFYFLVWPFLKGEPSCGTKDRQEQHIDREIWRQRVTRSGWLLLYSAFVYDSGRMRAARPSPALICAQALHLRHVKNAASLLDSVELKGKEYLRPAGLQEP